MIIFSFLKKDHSGDSVDLCKEKVHSRRGSEAVGCLSLSLFCNCLLPLTTWTNAILITVLPSQQSLTFPCARDHGETASKGTNGKHPSPVLERPSPETLIGDDSSQAQGGGACTVVASQRGLSVSPGGLMAHLGSGYVPTSEILRQGAHHGIQV